MNPSAKACRRHSRPPLLLRLTAAAFVLAAAWPAVAGEQADKALAAVRRLQHSGEIAPGTTLRLTVKQGNIAAFLGRDYELQREWEQQTGTRIDASLMPQLDSQAFIERTPGVDLTIARNQEYPDLFQRKLIEDLTPLMRRFGFTLPQDTGSGYMLVPQQAQLGQKVVAIPADGDVPLLFLRRDLLEDPGNRARYRERFGRELAAPATWEEYLDQAAFFHQPQKNFYGALEQREQETAWMFWLPRFAAFAPAPFLFDAQMRPLIDSPAGIAATENYVATVAWSPPEVLGEGKDYSYTLPFFMGGRGYSTIITPAGAKLFSLGASAVKDKFVAAPLPGHLRDGRLQRRSMLIYGNNLVMPRSGANKVLAFLYAMWLTDPDISVRSVGVPGGFADPYRYNHLRDERIRQVYSGQALDVVAQELPHVIPSGTGLPGNSEYLDVLNRHLHLAAQGRLSPQEAMKRTAREWEAITARYGRHQQIRHWQAFRQLFAEGQAQ